MKKRVKTIDICGQRWKFKIAPHRRGGDFWTCGILGNGVIRIGTKNSDVDDFIDSLIHEIAEGILTNDYKRWFDKWGGDKEDNRVVFIFDHRYLTEFTRKFKTALLSTGFFKIQNLPKFTRTKESIREFNRK